MIYQQRLVRANKFKQPEETDEGTLRINKWECCYIIILLYILNFRLYIERSP
jgi:hypothetical protein